MSGLESQLPALLLFLSGASVLAVATQRWLRAPYTVALAIVGLVFGTLGVAAPVELSYDLVIFVLLPALLFEGAASIDYHEMKKVLPAVVAVALVGLAVSIGVVGLAGQALFGFPLAVALLFGVIVMPTDPVAVIAVLDAVGTPEELATLVEGESLLNDGLSIVLYTSLLGIVLDGSQPGEFLTLSRGLSLAGNVAVSVFGGVAVGALSGFLVYQVLRRLDEPFPETLLTFVLAYGSFFVAEELLHASGVIATAAAALVMGNWGSENAMTVPTRMRVFNTWETLAFFLNTFVFLAIGVAAPLGLLWEHAVSVVLAVVLVLGIRPLVNYPLLSIAGRLFDHDVPPAHRIVNIWGGIHAVVSVALVLGLPQNAAIAPYRDRIRAMVFGVALAGLLVQAISLPWLIRALDIGEDATPVGEFEWAEAE